MPGCFSCCENATELNDFAGLQPAWIRAAAPQLCLFALAVVGVALSVTTLAANVVDVYSASPLFANAPVKMRVGLFSYSFEDQDGTAPSGNLDQLACSNTFLPNMHAARVFFLFSLFLALSKFGINARWVYESWTASPNSASGKIKTWSIVLSVAWGATLMIGLICEAAATNVAGYGLQDVTTFDPQQTVSAYWHLMYWRYGAGALGAFAGMIVAWLSFLGELILM
jgi:hypothetical protein